MCISDEQVKLGRLRCQTPVWTTSSLAVALVTAGSFTIAPFSWLFTHSRALVLLTSHRVSQLQRGRSSGMSLQLLFSGGCFLPTASSAVLLFRCTYIFLFLWKNMLSRVLQPKSRALCHESHGISYRVTSFPWYCNTFSGGPVFGPK